MISTCSASPAAPRRAASPGHRPRVITKAVGDRGGRGTMGRPRPGMLPPWPGRDKGRVLVRSSGSGQYRRRTAGSGGSGLESGGGDAAPRGRQARRGQGLRGARPGRLNGGSLAASARRRPSPVQCGINASSAPAIRHSSAGEGGETLDLVRIGADGSPHWLGVWPTAEDNPRHAGLELWMAVHGHQIVGKPASWSGSCED
jgi:hypothetical protein